MKMPAVPELALTTGLWFVIILVAGVWFAAYVSYQILADDPAQQIYTVVLRRSMAFLLSGITFAISAYNFFDMARRAGP